MRQLTRWFTLMGCTMFVGEVLAQDRQEPRRVSIRNGAVELHYLEYGTGDPVIFIHGALEDCFLWRDKAKSFGKSYRAIAYSRRFNHPNDNRPTDDFSPKLESEDVAELIHKLDLGRCHVIGFSYGGTVALFLAINHPELVRSLTLAEPALVPWFLDLSAPNTEKGKEIYKDYYTNLVEKAKLKFAQKDREGALRVTLDYLSSSDGFYDGSSKTLKSIWARNDRELEMIYTKRMGLQTPDREDVERLKMPRLLLSGEKSADSCQLAVAELEVLLSVKRHSLKGAGHAVWLDAPMRCNTIVLEFLRAN